LRRETKRLLKKFVCFRGHAASHTRIPARRLSDALNS
jgi:hypothetical protein